MADSLTLWKSPVIDENIWKAASYYSILARSPVGLFYTFAFIVFTGAVTILLSLRDGEAGNLMFDGGSICRCTLLPPNHNSPVLAVLFGTTVSMYVYSVVPGMRHHLIWIIHPP